MRCKHWDCGWCYAPEGSKSNDENGQCQKPDECLELMRQEADSAMAEHLRRKEAQK